MARTATAHGPGHVHFYIMASAQPMANLALAQLPYFGEAEAGNSGHDQHG